MNRAKPRPSRRGPRRDDVVTYRVQVELEETDPPLWRRLELASDLFLNEVHDIIQTAFGWTDSHLHEFAAGKDYYAPTSEHYLCPFQVEEGQIGVPEDEVRLDEVLAKQGDKLLYLYDFGDDWMHVIKLESVQPRDESAPRAVCVDGRRPGPGEDCGGVGGYEEICVALDPDHPDQAAAIAEYVSRYGDGADPRRYAPTPFDAERINAQLVALSNKVDVPGPLKALIDAIRSPASQQEFEQLLDSADLQAPVEIDAGTAAQMVAPYTWLLNRVGVDGIKLTNSGYLPPVHVEAAMSDLGLREEWMSKSNREVQTVPVLHLRESAQAMGLLRKHHGTVVLTKLGRALGSDPLALWWHLAERMPVPSRDDCERHAGLLFLSAIAAGSTGTPDGMIADVLTAIGWQSLEGTPMTPSMAARAAWNTRTVLYRLGAVVDEPGVIRPERITPDGVVFARAALSTWSSQS